MTGDRVAEIRERLDVGGLNKRDAADLAYLLAKNEQWKHIVVRVTNERNEWEANAATAETERDEALASRNRYWERLRSSERLLHEARGLLDHDKAEIVAEMERVREQTKVQWEEARAERAESLAERDAEVARLRAQLDTVRELADNAELTPIHVGGGNLVSSQLMVRHSKLRAALNQGGETNGE